MNAFIFSFLSTLLVSLISLIGVIFVAFKVPLQKIIEILVGFATGALFGDVFLHVLPEVIPEIEFPLLGLLILLGIFIFFVLEEFISWRHCHLETTKEHPHPVAFMNLFGDAAHNFFDGLAIGISFLTNFSLGLTTTLAIIFHEVPQEIGDFGVLLYAGLPTKRALFLNLLVALTALLGVSLPFVVNFNLVQLHFFLPVIAGGFIYIAGSDLVPLIKEQNSFKKSCLFFGAMIAGSGLMYLFLLLE